MRNKNGFTLLEIAISVAIFSIAIVGLVHLFLIGLHSSRRAINFSLTGIVGQRVIDNIKKAASIYDPEDTPFFTNKNGIGYFELLHYFPFRDEHIVPVPPPHGIISTPTGNIYVFEYPGTHIEKIHVESKTDDPSLGEKKMIQKVYITIYWKRGGAERFITYIANPFF